MRMKPSKRPLKTEDTISAVLRIGVSTSLVLLTLGTLLAFLPPNGYGFDRSEVSRLTGAGGAFPRSLSWLLGGLMHANGQAVIVLGLVLLIATPVVRVIVSTVAFYRERDRVYVAITLLVLALLLVSFVLGRSG